MVDNTVKNEDVAHATHEDVVHATPEEDDQLTSEKIHAQSVAAAAYELNRIDLDQISREALHWKSRATLRLLACILVQGLSIYIFQLMDPPTTSLRDLR